MWQVPKSQNRGRGSFWLPRKTINVLLANHATANQIGACLAIARYSDASGRFSSAGFKAIKKALGICDEMAVQATGDLQKMCAGVFRRKPLIFPPNRWFGWCASIPNRPTERARVRWIINDFNSGPGDRVWFANELIDGYGQFRQPLRRLKQCGDVAARLLLKLYEQNDMERWCGVKPFPNLCHKFKMAKKKSIGGIQLWHAEAVNDSAYYVLMNSVLHGSVDDANKVSEDEQQIFFDAVEALKSSGFIYYAVVVLDQDVWDKDAQMVYVLQTKNMHGDTPKGEEGLGGETARMAGKLGHPVTDKNGRFYGTFAVIVRKHIKPRVAGIYRLRFRVSNPRNRGVMSAWAQIHQIQEEAAVFLKGLDSLH